MHEKREKELGIGGQIKRDEALDLVYARWNKHQNKMAAENQKRLGEEEAEEKSRQWWDEVD